MMGIHVFIRELTLHGADRTDESEMWLDRARRAQSELEYVAKTVEKRLEGCECQVEVDAPGCSRRISSVAPGHEDGITHRCV